MGLHPGNHLAGAEGLGDVVVRAQAQTADLVNVLLLGGYHDNGGIFYFPYLFTDFKTVGAGEHEVQNKQIKFLIQRLSQPCISSVTNLNLKSGQFQIVFLQICDCFFIFYD